MDTIKVSEAAQLKELLGLFIEEVALCVPEYNKTQ